MVRGGLLKVCVVGAMLAIGMGGTMPANAADAGAFLKQLAGNYRGRGSAKLDGRDNTEKVSCQVTNTYDAGSRALTVRGNCASTQAKSSVSGKMVHNGDNVSGSLFASGEVTVTKSSGSVKGGKLTVSTNFSDKTSGKLTRTLQVIRRSGSGFEAEFFTYNYSNKKFERTGSIRFSRS
ncbi:MAG: hypothetical protein KDJ90_03760 [Nitratireductor sp.]|nr:hypothetical protein [Nitratireductor sp.]